MSVSSCRCCMFVYCVHPVAVLSVASSMTCILIVLVEDERGNHMEEAYYRAYKAVMSVSFCLPHLVAVSDFIICSGLYACTEML